MEENKPKVLYKWIIVLAVIFVIALAVVYDNIRAGDFNIQVVSIDPQPAPADGQSPIHIKVKVLYKGQQIVKGHDLYAISENGGGFSAYRVRTDENGEAEFKYFPYMATETQPIEDVHIRIYDESNSVFVGINATTSFTVKMMLPEKQEETQVTGDSIYGEDEDSQTTDDSIYGEDEGDQMTEESIYGEDED